MFPGRLKSGAERDLVIGAVELIQDPRVAFGNEELGLERARFGVGAVGVEADVDAVEGCLLGARAVTVDIDAGDGADDVEIIRHFRALAARAPIGEIAEVDQLLPDDFLGLDRSGSGEGADAKERRGEKESF